MPTKRPIAAVFVHGLARKPPVEKLKELWLWGLARDNPMPNVFAPPNRGINLASRGVAYIFNYYADVFYGMDYESNIDSYYEAEGDPETADLVADPDFDSQPMQHTTPRERDFVRNFQAKLESGPAMTLSPVNAKATIAPDGSDLELVGWLPDSIKQALVKKAAMEAYYFLFDKEYVRSDKVRFRVRQELRARLVKDLATALERAERLIIVAHSMGTMVAYDVLRNCSDCPRVDTLITLGSPLGVTEVQDELVAENALQVDFPVQKLNHWINVYDPLDPVCAADPRLANDFQSADGKVVVDVKESNWGSWRHSITHYLAGTEFRARFSQGIS